MKQLYIKLLMLLPMKWQKTLRRIEYAIKDYERANYVIYRKDDEYLYSKGNGFVKPVITNYTSFEVYDNFEQVDVDQAMLKQQGYETGVYTISCVQTNQAHFMMFLR
jgi:hypothetical protein